LQLLQRQPRLVGKWILATDIEHEVYPNLLECFGWAPRRSTHNWAALFVPLAGRQACGNIGSHPPRRARAKHPTALESLPLQLDPIFGTSN
jgi:hypothetical protein